ncbi:hypothetical protein ACFY12_34095 [Streptomyces sp. NPDC001339]|uniref:hypothetical protein n=1 Tax=Streptomyces sp. NPDC001339 TaxID=3364563 RepID=UPI003680A94B
MAATETEKPVVRTARVRDGFHPEDAFTGVTLTPPPAAEVWCHEESGRAGAGTRYHQWFAIDLRTGEVWFGDTDYTKPEEWLREQLPGHLRRYSNDEIAPPNDVAIRLIDHSGYTREHGHEWSFFTADELYEVATAALPIVQRMMDTIHRVGPRGDLEWSAAASAAWGDFEKATEPRIERGTVTWPEPVIHPVSDWRHEAAEFLERYPELIPADLATASDAELDRIAAYKPKAGYGGVAGYLSTHDSEIYDAGWGGNSFFGNRAALYAYRTKAAGGRTQVSAEQWLGTEAGQRAVAAATKEYGALAGQSDDRLTQFAARLQAAAVVENLAVTGLTEQLQHRRAAEHRAVEDLLHREGAEVARLEGLLKEARGRRRTSLARVLAWSGDRTDRDLGALASMSHTAVGELRNALTADDDTEQD